MHLSWFGFSAFKIETKGVVLVTDPFSPKLAAKPVRAKADIVTVSAPENPFHNYLGGIQGEPFHIDHPGEFEVKGIFIQGISSGNRQQAVGSREPKKAGRRDAHPSSLISHLSTVFTFDIEGMRVAHLGDLREIPSSDVLERMDGVDVLLVPVGGGKVTLDAEGAARIINDIEPRLVVPMHFATDGIAAEGKLASAAAFLREMGASKVAPVDRLLLKKRDLPTEETRVVVFRP